jgi:hypothetical protein
MSANSGWTISSISKRNSNIKSFCSSISGSELHQEMLDKQRDGARLKRFMEIVKDEVSRKNEKSKKI